MMVRGKRSGPVVKALWFHPGTAASDDYNKEIRDICYTEA